MGNARKPTLLHEADGTVPQVPRSPAEPTPVFVELECPPDLSPAEQTAWKGFAARAHAMHITTEEDAWALKHLAVLWAEWEEIQAWRRGGGQQYIEAYKGTGKDKKLVDVKPDPRVARLRILDAQIKSYFTRFGLTPGDRSRVEDLRKKKLPNLSGKGRPNRNMPTPGAEVSDPDSEFM